MTRKKSRAPAATTGPAAPAAAPRRAARTGRPGRQVVDEGGELRDEIAGDIVAAERRPARCGQPGRVMLPAATTPKSDKGG